VGILIKELDMPVVPVYIKGSHKSWPRTRRLPRFYPVKVTFGKPVSAKELGDTQEAAVASDDYETIARGLREKVIKLS
jgi:1-acyl-sn-glycerol-3-phosphate acyltransferase